MMCLEYKNYSDFYEALDSVLQEENKWKKIKVTKLKYLIMFNLRLINEQTQNVAAPILQKKLLQLSHKINQKFNSPFAHNLAFEIMGIAKGIFSDEKDRKNYTAWLPIEIRQQIYKELIDPSSYLQNRIFSGLNNIRLINEVESIIAKEIKIAWINNTNVSLKSCGFNTIQDAIYYIKNNQTLYSINLSEFENLTEKDLKELQNCTWIQELFISSKNFTDDDLKFIEKMTLKKVKISFSNQLTDKAFEHLKALPLQSINFWGCHLLTDKALEYLKELPLQSVNFTHCHLLTDKAIEYLKELPLKSVRFNYCPLLTDKALEYLKGKLLQEVEFFGCDQLTDKSFEFLKGMPLQRVNFCKCNLLTDKAFEYLKDSPLQFVNFNHCPLLTDKIFEYLMEMPLQNVSFYGCTQLTDNAVKNFKQRFISLGFELYFMV